MINKTLDEFTEKGYVCVRDFIDTDSIAIVSQYFENKIRRGEWQELDNVKDATTKYYYYADPLVEVMLLRCKVAVETNIGKELLPTYSYSRIYQPGEQLFPHVDRPSCEISVTVNVANKGEKSPIYMQYKNNEPVKFVLNPGDALIYLGRDVMHWRRPLNPDQLTVQFMLHYVDKNGPFVDYAVDKRVMYGTTRVKE